MNHTADPDEILEIPGDELRPVVRDDPGPRVGISLARPLDDRLDIGPGHALADLPVDDEPVKQDRCMRVTASMLPWS